MFYFEGCSEHWRGRSVRERGEESSLQTQVAAVNTEPLWTGGVPVSPHLPQPPADHHNNICDIIHKSMFQNYTKQLLFDQPGDNKWINKHKNNDFQKRV